MVAQDMDQLRTPYHHTLAEPDDIAQDGSTCVISPSGCSIIFSLRSRHPLLRLVAFLSAIVNSWFKMKTSRT